jgi:lysophospholipase L1-like esterase
MSAGSSAAQFIAGCLYPPQPDAAYPRAELEQPVSRLPRDTWAAACIPAGVRLEFEGAAQAVRVSYRCRNPSAANAGQWLLTRQLRNSMAQRFELWNTAELLAAAPAAPECDIAASVELPLSGSGPYTLYLPELLLPQIDAVEAIGGALHPRRQRARWLAYGDSITEGWCASAAARCWTACAARELDLDLVNLGYSGAARGEIAVAEMLAQQRADAISVAFGTNCWSRVAHDGSLFAATLRTFLQIVRAAHPAIPIIALSPTLRPDGENRANARGLSHGDLRGQFEHTVKTLIAAGDGNLHLLEGLPLISAADLVDGVHPDDAGHAKIAAAVAAVLARVINSR